MIGYQCGRVLSYSLAGLLFGSVLGVVVGWLDIESVRRSLRVLTAAALMFGALIALGGVRDPNFAIGRRLWSKLAPLGRRLLWGWIPCGFVYTVLLMAALQADAVQSAATMLAFGLGTTPALFATATVARRVVGIGASPFGRRIAGGVLLASSLLTLIGPWLLATSPWLHAHLPFGCEVLR
jgi:sulfite exporter TauE/SafE